MKYYLSLVIFACSVFFSCEKSESDSTIVTMDNKSIDFNIPAFSLSKGKVIRLSDPEADFVVLNMINESELTGVYLSAIIFDSTFALLETFDSADSASISFDTLSSIPDVPFEPLAIPVFPHQIWAVRTHDNKFGKILILETAYYDIKNTPYARITFKWAYQKNGTRYF